MPDELKGQKVYEPGENARENEIKRSLQTWWKDWYGY
jgi:putative ATPase